MSVRFSAIRPSRTSATLVIVFALMTQRPHAEEAPNSLDENSDRQGENIVATPTPAASSTPSLTPTPEEQLTIPRDLKDLNGCWQSVRGDITFFSDDAEHRPIGSVRICYCFDENGRGSSRYKYRDGTTCIGPLRAQLSQDGLFMSHARINCVGNPAIGYVVAADVLCSRRPGEDSASCDTDWHFRYPTKSKDERFHRVSFEYCN